jgi:diguanylate cyclase (GGDEF)-like protein/PAS domain S-box-containing protein
MSENLSSQNRLERLEMELRAERTFTRRYLDLSGSMVILLSPNELVHLANRSALSLLGYSREELIGQNWFDKMVPDVGRDGQRRRFREMMATSRDLFRQESESQVLTKSGDLRDISWGVSVLANPSGRAVGQLMSGEDVTEVRRAKKTIEHMAFHDQLTGLPNRAFLHKHLPTLVSQSQRQSWSAALLFMDFDNFKACNDTYGHATGDELLRQISTRLHATIRPDDILVRLGGDEFVMVLSDLAGNRAEARQQAGQVASRLRQAFGPPFSLGEDIQHQSGASIGIALCPHDAQDPDDLLSQADHAMYTAKQTGKNRFIFYADVELA